MNRISRLISGMLVVIFVLTSTMLAYPSTVFAANGGQKDLQKPVQNTINQNREKTEIIVKYKSSGKQKNVADRIKGKRKLSKFNIKRSFKMNRVDLVEIDKSDDIDKTVAELKKDPDVEYAQPNYKLDITSIPTDARFQEQWGLSNSGQEVEGYTGRSGVDIKATTAWDLIQSPSAVVIGVLDTGIDIAHEDLTGNIYVNTGETPNNHIDDDNNGYVDDTNGWDFVNNDNTLYDASDIDIHGTQVAGVIAAKANSLGISGVAPNVKLMPLKFINGNWGYTCDAIDAIEYAMSKGVKIINCSFGGTDDNFALKDTMVNSGILFICSGGNRGSDVSVLPIYPACFDIPNVLSVASIDSMGVISPYSSFGNKIHVAAPGINILSTTPGNTYGYFSGTSASAPFVTGIAALLQSYLPALSINEIAARIKNNTVPCTNLVGKVTSGGRVNAFAALSNVRPGVDNYTGPGNDKGTVPAGQQGGNEDTWYTLDQLAKIKEKLHYGEGGVNPASGNFSFTVNDMSIPAPGFQVNISRTYNSRDNKSTPLGQGWTFGFEGKVEGTDVVSVTLPSGGAQRFRLSGGVYTPEDNRSTFIRNTDGTYLLTTKDRYKYTFNSNGYLTGMEDRNGNVLGISVDPSNGRISTITDTVGRAYTLAYNANGLISSVTDIENRQVRYEYENNRLVRVIDPKGGVMRYTYDPTWGFLTEIKDHNEKTVEKIVYNHTEGENQHKVSQATDSLGDIANYAYDMTNKKTAITDMNGRVSTYWFDKDMYTIQVQDPEGKSSYTEYYMPDGTNKYGDVKSTTDRNGNKTAYDIDSRGNVLKITNPDLSTKLFKYDDKDNQIEQTDEAGRTTYFVYDTNKINLDKKVRPLDGTTLYTGVDSADFAITCYEYYTGIESGCRAKKLLKSEKDPEGNITTYTYDADGNVKTVSDPETNKVTTFEYNRIGWKTAGITAKGIRTEYSYDKNGQLIKTTIISSKNETSRTVYNLLGQKTQEISPNQYNASNDNLTADTYSDNTAGTRYTYYDSGKLKSETDALGHITSYEYDVYGNITKVTKPNGSISIYKYDVMDRPVKESFKDTESSDEILLKEYSYAVMEDCKTQTTETTYLNAVEQAITVSVYDYANRLKEKNNPDGSMITMNYNSDGTLESSIATNGSTTYYKYNGLGLLSEQWTPLEVSDGNTKFSYNKTEYYKNGLKYKESAGKGKVLLYEKPIAGSTVSSTFEYYKNGKLKRKTDGEGREAKYSYDDDGNVIKEEILAEASNYLTTDYTYNYLEKVATKAQHVNEGDLYGKSFDSTAGAILLTEYTYDRNGNVKTVKTPDLVVTTYDYDVLNRQTGISMPGLDESGAPVTISTSTTYNWEGKLLTTTDANNKSTAYDYNPRGFLTKVTDAKNGVTLYAYDLAGRKLAEVSPVNYSSTKTLSEMNRTEYLYDLLNRVKVKKDIYYDTRSNKWISTISKAYRYDNSGNVVKELDAIGYESGTGSTVDEKTGTGYGTQYTYNLAGKLATFKDPVSEDRALSFTTKYEYDGLGRKTTETNANGVISVYGYDDAGNIVSTGIKKDAAAVLQELQSSDYDLAGRLTSRTDGNGHTSAFEYNALSKLRKTVSPGDASIPSNTIKYQYDEMGNLKKQSDSTGLVELYDYDNQGRQLSYIQEDASGSNKITTSKKYDKNGNVRFEIDGKGYTTEKTYDSLNRLETVSLTVSGIRKTESYEYDANGNQTTSTDWRGNTSTNVYDALNRLVEKHDPYVLVQKLEYNKNNVQVKSYDALDNPTQYIYDKNNRLIATLDPEGHTTSQSYDDVGNIKAKTDGRGITTTTYDYDEFNRIKSVKNAKSEKTDYTYDLNGNMLSQTDGNCNTTNYIYNAADKLVKKIDQGGMAGRVTINAKTESYTYYADGSTKTQTDRNGVNTTFNYDIHGRLVSQTAGSSTISYTYDNNGNQLNMLDSTGTTTRTYDEQNRVTGKTVPVIGSTTYGYDGIESNGGYSETTADPKGNITKKVYDKAGRLVNVIAGGKTTTYTYYDNGSHKNVHYNDGSTEEYTYYADGLNETLINKKANGDEIDHYSYTYDEAHNQISKTDFKGTTSYIYDSLGRLESTTEPNGRVTGYTFDKAGNRLTEAVTVGTSSAITTYNYNEQNRLTDTVTNNGSETVTVCYAYDNNGNMVNKSTETKKPVNQTASGSFKLYKAGTATESAITFYRYDVWNQLTEAISGDKKEKYKYNGVGYRVAKNDNGQITNYLYEYDKVVLETDNAGSQLARNVYGTNLISRTSGNETLYYMYNGHADVTALIDNAGVIKAPYYYDAFGTPIAEYTNEGGKNNPIRYAGYQYDGETGLYYLNSRYYDSKIARFLSEDTYTGDPNDPLSLNLYTYCQNNPIMYWDPTGHYLYTTYDPETGITEVRESEVIVDKDHPYVDYGVPNDGIFVYSDTGYINASNSVGVGVNSGVTVGEVEVSAGSTSTIYNYGTIGTINTGSSSSTTINNNETGYIGSITFGAKSTNEINNEGMILTVENGGKTHTEISNTGFLGSATRGAGFSSLSVNGKNYNEYKMTANYNINEPWKNSLSGKYGVSDYDAAMLRSIYGVGNDNNFAFELYNMLPIVVQAKIDIWKEKNSNLAKSNPNLFYTKYADEVLNYFDASKEYADMFEGMDEAIKTKSPVLILAAAITFGGTNTNSKLKLGGTTRVRHYTNRKGINGIEQDSKIIASDNNRVYVEPASNKALSQNAAETKYQLKPGRGKDYVEFDVPNSQLEWVKNPRYGTPELTIKGNVDLQSPSFQRRK
jgi:RHS repeat-associated protein